MTISNKLKVCLLMHGQPRFVNNPYALTSHKQKILDKYDCDVICHAWFGDDLILPASSWSGINDVSISRNSLSVIESKIKPMIMEADDPRNFSLNEDLEKRLITKFSDQPGWTKSNISNVLSSLFSIEKVAKIAKTLDLAKYDFVVLSRYDNLIYNLPDLNLLKKDKFYLSDHHSKFPDLLFIFSPKFLDTFLIYSKVESLIEEHFDEMWGPSMNEPLKMFSFKSKFDLENDLIPISLPVRVVRDAKSRGDLSMLERYSLTKEDMMINWRSKVDLVFYCKILFGRFLKHSGARKLITHLISFAKRMKKCLVF